MAADFSYQRLPNETGWSLARPNVYVDSPDIGIEVVIRRGMASPRRRSVRWLSAP